MRGPPTSRITYALGHAAELASWSLSDWDLLVRQARQADLLARVGSQLEDLGLLAAIPPQPRAHVEGAMRLARAQADETRREIHLLTQALAPIGLPVLLLKGAAYLAAGLPPAAGRLFSDTDILVPRARLAEVESTLVMKGWMTTHHSAYDQRYYREWSHELPPMEHMRRRTVLDVHHSILAPTSRLKPDAAKLLAAARPVAGLPGVQVLAPADMVLHSMSHLFHNSEFSHGLRDLSDLDLLLRHFGAARGFHAELASRARELDLTLPMYYGLRYATRILATPVPEDLLAQAEQAAPAWPLSPLMDGLWQRALGSQHVAAAPRFTQQSLWLLYVRAHWLRMPPWLLARHLAIKAWQRRRDGMEAPR